MPCPEGSSVQPHRHRYRQFQVVQRRVRLCGGRRDHSPVRTLSADEPLDRRRDGGTRGQRGVPRHRRRRRPGRPGRPHERSALRAPDHRRGRAFRGIHVRQPDRRRGRRVVGRGSCLDAGGPHPSSRGGAAQGEAARPEPPLRVRDRRCGIRASAGGYAAFDGAVRRDRRCARTRGVRSLLPAPVQALERPDRGGRSARALAASVARPGQPRRVHPAARAQRRHRRPRSGHIRAVLPLPARPSRQGRGHRAAELQLLALAFLGRLVRRRVERHRRPLRRPSVVSVRGNHGKRVRRGFRHRDRPSEAAARARFQRGHG